MIGASRVAPRMSVQTDEAALIRAAQEGDQDAFEQLVRAYDQSVLRLAMNLLRSPEDAHDVYQEAFLRVYRNLNNFRFDCNVTPGSGNVVLGLFKNAGSSLFFVARSSTDDFLS